MLTSVIRLLLLLAILGNSNFAIAYSKHDEPFSKRTEVQRFVHEMHKKHGFNKKHLLTIFQEYHTNKKVLSTMDKQFEAMPWYGYRDRLITNKRITEGVLFWKQNKTLLNKASKRFGVPPEIIIAIIGIESSYGQNTGTYPVLQTLCTLAFDYPRRAAFFRKELEHFLLLFKEGALHPTETRGSYAGAMGMPQFMPSSYRQFAVDFSGKGKRDLIHNKADVIGSIANYLKVHGWQPQSPIIHRARISGSLHKRLKSSKDLTPHITLKDLAKYHIYPVQQQKLHDKTQKVKWIALDSSKNTKEHWMGFHNFYVITRYNHSIHYAMAVSLLSEHIRALYEKKV